jgi:hypothetical protein
MDGLILFIVGVNGFSIPVFTCFFLPNPVSGSIIAVAEHRVLPVFFQKLSAYVILICDIQRAASVGCRSLHTCFGQAVPIAVILVTERQQDVASHAGFQMRYVAICVILTGHPDSVPVADLFQTVQTVIEVPDGAVPVRDPGDLISVVVLIALKDFVRAVPPLPPFGFSDLAVQCILICGLIPETVSLHGWHVLKIAASFLHHLVQAVGSTDAKNSKTH